jgi:hypothetical protein
MILDYREKIINIENSSKETIHCVYNYTNKELPLIVIPPQFEKTIRTNLTTMLYLINNGFNVLRFDNRNHNGNSTGRIQDYSLGGAYDDLVEVVNFIKEDPNVETENGMGILGISIASRIIYRYLSLNKNVFDVFVSLAGVVNMKYTLNSILGYDIVQEYLSEPNRDFGIKKLLKYPIDYNNFLHNLVNVSLHTLESTQMDIDRIVTPISLIVSENDKWIDYNECSEAFKNNADILVEMFKLPGAGHELYKNPQSAEVALNKIVELFRSHWNMTNENYIIHKPEITEIISLNKLERERERFYINL